MNNSKFKRIMMMGLVIASTAINTLAGNIPKVNLNGEKVMLQQSPFVESGRTYVPLRAISENLGATVGWEPTTQTVTINNDTTTVVCKIGSSTAKVNNEPVTLDAAPKIKLGTTYVPLRFTADCLGAKISYDQKTNTIGIEYEVKKDSTKKYIDDRAIRTTNLPKNAKDFAYILEGIPNEMYQLEAQYEYKNNAIEGKNFIRPRDITTSSFYSEENLKQWKETIEKHLDLKLNIDYRTIDDKWAEEMTSTYMACQKKGQGNYDKYLKYTKDYVKYVKENKVIIEGDYYVEPNICYSTSGSIYMRSWVGFNVKSSANGKAELFENHASAINTGKTYTGYVDMGLATNNGNSKGQDLGMIRDTISEAVGVSAKSSSLNIANYQVAARSIATNRGEIECRD